jgi:hypothetical protein
MILLQRGVPVGMQLRVEAIASLTLRPALTLVWMGDIPANSRKGIIGSDLCVGVRSWTQRARRRNYPLEISHVGSLDCPCCNSIQ